MIKLKEDEQKQLNARMHLNGHTSYQTTFFDSKEYDSLRTCMLNHLKALDDKRLKFKFCDKSEILRAGRYVIDKHMGNIDLKIPYTDGDNLETQLVARFGQEPKREDYEDIIRYVKNHLELVRVTDVPLALDTNKKRNGHVVTTRFYGYKKVDDDYHKKLPVCTHEIKITGPCDENSKLIYVHEMTHALLNRNKGSVQNKLNDEALSIFMEKIAANDLDSKGDLLNLKTLMRILQIKHNILDKEIEDFREENGLGILTDETYIISSLLATDLFNTYMKGSNKTKEEIFKAISEVLMGKKVLEDVFTKFEITEDKGSKIMKRQIKNFGQS